MKGLLDAGWSMGSHHCPETTDDIGSLSHDWRIASYSGGYDRGVRHFRGLYIHNHLDDPTLVGAGRFYKNMPLPSWWWIVTNKERS